MQDKFNCLNLFVLFGTYLNPKPSQESISSALNALHAAVLENLSSKSVSATIIPFRHDVFHYLFKGKGKNKYKTFIEKTINLLLEKQDFSRCTFPYDWDKLLDSLGDEGKVDFPIEARLFILRSPKKHTVSKEKQ